MYFKIDDKVVWSTIDSSVSSASNAASPPGISEQSLSPQTIPSVEEPYLLVGVPFDLSPSASWMIGRAVIDTKRIPKVRKIRIFFVIDLMYYST